MVRSFADQFAGGVGQSLRGVTAPPDAGGRDSAGLRCLARSAQNRPKPNPFEESRGIRSLPKLTS